MMSAAMKEKLEKRNLLAWVPKPNTRPTYRSILARVSVDTCSSIGRYLLEYRSILARVSVDTCSSIGRYLLEYRSILARVSVDTCSSIGRYLLEYRSILARVSVDTCSSIGRYLLEYRPIYRWSIGQYRPICRSIVDRVSAGMSVKYRRSLCQLLFNVSADSVGNLSMNCRATVDGISVWR